MRVAYRLPGPWLLCLINYLALFASVEAFADPLINSRRIQHHPHGPQDDTDGTANTKHHISKRKPPGGSPGPLLTWFDNPRPDFKSLNWDGKSVDHGRLLDALHASSYAGHAGWSRANPWDTIGRNLGNMVYQFASITRQSLERKGLPKEQVTMELRTVYERLEELVSHSPASMNRLEGPKGQPHWDWTEANFLKAAKSDLNPQSLEAFFKHHPILTPKPLGYTDKDTSKINDWVNSKPKNKGKGLEEPPIVKEALNELIVQYRASNIDGRLSKSKVPDLIKDILTRNRGNLMVEFGKKIFHETYVRTGSEAAAYEVATLGRTALLQGVRNRMDKKMWNEMLPNILPESEFLQTFTDLDGYADFVRDHRGWCSGCRGLVSKHKATLDPAAPYGLLDPVSKRSRKPGLELRFSDCARQSLPPFDYLLYIISLVFFTRN